MAEPMMSRPLIYIAGPYTHPDPVENTHDTIKVADRLVDTGLVTPVVPHVSLLWHIITPRPVDFWYEYDLALLARCDAVLRLPGSSSGADKEVELAYELQIPVFYSEENALRFAQTRWVA